MPFPPLFCLVGQLVSVNVGVETFFDSDNLFATDTILDVGALK